MAPAKTKTEPTEAEKAAAKAKRQTEKTERFVKLAPPRMTKCLKALDQIANLGNRGSYAYTPEQRQKIADVLNAKVKAVLASFADDAKAGPADGFSF